LDLYYCVFRGCSFYRSVDTLQRNEEFCGIYKSQIEIGRSSLRRMQWKAAENGDKTMLVWLGKQYLGQRDKQETEISGKDGGSLEIKIIGT